MNGSIAIIGAGNMGGAIYQALTVALPQTDIYVSDSDTGKLDSLNVPEKRRLLDINEVLQHDILYVLLCIKPQSLSEFAKQLQVKLDTPVLVSILAGTPLSRLQAVTESKKIVRAMPNLAAFVGKSVTGWIATTGVTEMEKQSVKKIFQAFGSEIELSSEDKINDITALSGSGPAYFFYLTQLLEEKAVEMGLTQEDAAQIAMQTLAGASGVLQTGVKSAKEWKKAVTSPGGTTQAALEHLEKMHFHQIFQNAIQKTKERAEELSR